MSKCNGCERTPNGKDEELIMLRAKVQKLEGRNKKLAYLLKEAQEIIKIYEEKNSSVMIRSEASCSNSVGEDKENLIQYSCSSTSSSSTGPSQFQDFLGSMKFPSYSLKKADVYSPERKEKSVQIAESEGTVTKQTSQELPQLIIKENEEIKQTPFKKRERIENERTQHEIKGDEATFDEFEKYSKSTPVPIIKTSSSVSARNKRKTMSGGMTKMESSKSKRVEFAPVVPCDELSLTQLDSMVFGASKSNKLSKHDHNSPPGTPDGYWNLMSFNPSQSDEI